MSWFDHLPDWEARLALEAIGDEMEGLEFNFHHASGETEECNIQERVGIVVRRYEEGRAENRKLARWLRHLADNLECPVCSGEADRADSHDFDCEFAAWLGSRDREEADDA